MAAADPRFLTPYGAFKILRYPARRAEPLQAWCTADSLLLEHCHTQGIEGRDILVVNDDQGALCVPLQPRALWTDSALAATALEQNLERNNRSPVPLVWSTDSLNCKPRCVVLRVPKQLPYFEYQLAVLSHCLPPGATVLAAGMDKHLSPRTADILERHIGPTQRHRGQRKARLFSAIRDDHAVTDATSDGCVSYFCEELQAELHTLPNVFSRDKLDIGSRFLLQQFSKLKPVDTVVDLACGNGVLGLAAAARGLARQQLLFCDESAMALASARINSSSLLPDSNVAVSYYHGDGLLGYSGPAADLILCNPPFHLHHTVDEFAGRHLLAQCAQGLRSGGQLCLVANRHLDYLPTLRRGFRTVEKLAQNGKFIVWLVQKG